MLTIDNDKEPDKADNDPTTPINSPSQQLDENLSPSCRTSQVTSPHEYKDKTSGNEDEQVY
jgi:hypothetical protein